MIEQNTFNKQTRDGYNCRTDGRTNDKTIKLYRQTYRMIDRQNFITTDRQKEQLIDKANNRRNELNKVSMKYIDLPWQTTKISADSFREACGLVACTFLKNCWKIHMSGWQSLERKTLVMKVPPLVRNSQASLSAISVRLACEKASCCQFAPTFGAPSFSTTSTFHVCSSFLRD